MVNVSMLNTNSWECKLVTAGRWVEPSYLTLPTPLFLKATPLNPPCDQVTSRLTPWLQDITQGYSLAWHNVVVVTGTLSMQRWFKMLTFNAWIALKV